MKDNKKKILAAAAFLIAAGLVFGMSKKENGIRPSVFQKFETAEKPQDAAHGSRKLEKL